MPGVLWRLVAVVLAAAVLPVASSGPVSAAVEQRRFASLDDATKSLVEAFRSGDVKTMVAVLGEDGRRLVASGDAVSDRRVRERFVAAYDEKHRLEGGGGKVVLVVGQQDFPFPIPLVPEGPVWRWDTAAGKEEIINRRVGQNELNTMQVALAYVDAQREYYVTAPQGGSLLEYAQKFVSSPGKRDGLYWPTTKPGESPSPLGLFVARARGEGYRRATDRPNAYWGYYYRILTAQGKDAPGGAYDYLAKGRMIGGFALVAYPAQYGTSGVMTFIVNHDGVVYQKDLGPKTASLAQSMKAFNPDSTWQKAQP